jgi:hypothetical protein
MGPNIKKIKKAKLKMDSKLWNKLLLHQKEKRKMN